RENCSEAKGDSPYRGFRFAGIRRTAEKVYRRSRQRLITTAIGPRNRSSSDGWSDSCGRVSCENSGCVFRSGRGTGSLLAGVDDFHALCLLAVHRLEHVCDNPVVTFDDPLVAALDLLARQRAAFLRGANQLRAGGVEVAEAMGDRATQAAGTHGREL